MRRRYHKKDDKQAQKKDFKPRFLTLIYRGIDNHLRPDPDTKEHVRMGRAVSQDGHRTTFFLKASTSMRGEEGGWRRKLHMNQTFRAKVLGRAVLEVEPEINPSPDDEQQPAPH